MDPQLWGPSCWGFLHTITLDPRCKTQQCDAQKRLLVLLKKILPCQKCRRFYQEFVRDNLEKCDNLGEFLCDLHQKVNVKLGKGTLRSAEEWKKYYIDKYMLEGWNVYVDDLFYFLFTLAFNYPQDWAHTSQIAAAYAEFFTLLPQAIPSEKFQSCFELQIKLRPLQEEVLRTRQALVTWIYEIYKACVPAEQQKSLEVIKGAFAP